MASIRIHKTEKVIEAKDGTPLLRALLDAQMYIENPCNGMGNCGKCKVRLWDDEDLKGTKSMARSTHESGQKGEIYLACQYEVLGDIEVEILSKEYNHQILTSGHVPDFEIDGQASGYGVAMDIGTTTVVAELVVLLTGEVLESISMLNAQKVYGLDVLTRITHEYTHGESGITALQTILVNSIDEMLIEVCTMAGIHPGEISRISISANTTMVHMLLGFDARTLGRYPYITTSVDAIEVQATDIGICTANRAIVYCLPHVSAYIGADVVSGVYVCRFHEGRETALFIDIGTNGEIALSIDGEIICCSCAAGPALEGMNIEHGMRAAEGAVEAVRISHRGVQITTINGKAPVGICGSGILSAVNELLHKGLVKSSGAFIKKEELSENDYRQSLIRLNGSKREFVLSEEPKLIVTQKDIRQVQLAKGAMLSGLVALMKQAEITFSNIETVYIAGQFGAFLPKESLIGVGILPEECRGKLVYVGNSSKTGAYMSLLSQRAKREIEKLAKKMKYIELALIEDYEKILMESMRFPEYIDEGL